MEFFFQAEDGIRDIGVTGVQTCALPIFPRVVPNSREGTPVTVQGLARQSVHPYAANARGGARKSSEERRAGEECRSRSAQLHEKTNRERVSISRVVVS